MTEYLAQFATLKPGTYMVLTPDQKGDGYDVACVDRPDISDQIADASPTGTRVYTIRANGFVSGYQVVVPDPNSDEITVLTQHQGQHGPWYHEAVYRRAPHAKTGYVFVSKIGGHYSHTRAKRTGLPMGRPDRRQAEYAY